MLADSLYATDTEVPSHVPDDLVRNWPLKVDAKPGDPYDEIIPELHRGPKAIFAVDGLPQIVGGCWVFRQASVVREIYQTPELFSSSRVIGMSQLMGETWDQIPVEVDRPDHHFYRMLLNPFFTAKRIKAMEEGVRGLCDKYVQDMFGEKETGDFSTEFTQRFPIAVFLQLIDLPLENVDTYLAYEHDLLVNTDLEAKRRSAFAVKHLLEDAIAERTKAPRDDLISQVIQAEFGGRRLTSHEVMATAYNFYLGGLDTVTSMLGWIFRHLAMHQDQQDELRRNPELLPAAAEELYRAFAVAATYRRVTRDVDFHGVMLKADDKIMCSTPLTCRDPELCDRPGVVDFHRGTVRHLTFATGPHLCIGMHLAKREMMAALQGVLGATKRFWIKDGGAVHLRLGNVLNVERLDLAWER